jgi:hypothetical protein
MFFTGVRVPVRGEEIAAPWSRHSARWYRPRAGGVHERVHHYLRKLEPPLSVVRVDDVITWINTAPVPHTATSRTGEFDSGAIDRASLGSAQQRARAPFHICVSFTPR